MLLGDPIGIVLNDLVLVVKEDVHILVRGGPAGLHGRLDLLTAQQGSQPGELDQLIDDGLGRRGKRAGGA